MNFSAWVIQIMEQLGYFGIALLMFLDNIFPPIPSELIMPSAGYAASQGQLLFIGVVIAGCIGSISAACCLYWVGYRFQQQRIFAWVERYGKYLFIKTQHVRSALDYFEKYNQRIVFWGRMIPAVRSLISIPAGISRMHFGKFLFYSSLGTVIWTLFLASVGFYFGQNQQYMMEILSQVSSLIILALLLILAYILFKRFQSKAKSKS